MQPKQVMKLTVLFVVCCLSLSLVRTALRFKKKIEYWRCDDDNDDDDANQLQVNQNKIAI